MSGGAPVLGGIFAAGGSLMEAADKADAYRQRADQYTANAKMNRQVGEYNAMRQQMIAGKKIGAMEASSGASGVAADSGSVLDVLAASRANAEMDRLNIIHGAEVRAQSLDDRAREDIHAADRSIQMGYYNAFTSVFTGSAKGGMMAGPSTPSQKELDSGGDDYGD